MPQDLIVIGAGGHAKVVIATARAAGFRVIGAVDDDQARWGSAILGVAISGPVSRVLEDRAACAVLAIGHNATRRRLGAMGSRWGAEGEPQRREGFRADRWATIVHPSAIVDASVALGPGSVVFAGAIIQPDARLGAHAIVNTGASIDHDCALGDAVHVAPGARLAGNVALGDEVFFGIGAVAIPGVSVGARTTVGAGAAVVDDLPADVIAAGVPARVLRARA